MGLFRFKGILLALLLVSLLLCLRFEATDAKRGRHWRPRRSVPNTSSLTKKKVKVGNRHHRSQHSGGGADRRSSPSPSPSPNRKPNPSPSPSTPSSNPNPSPSPSTPSSNPNPSSSIPTPAPNPSPTPFPSPITPTPTTNPSPSPIPNPSPSIPSPNPGKGNLPSQHAVVFNVLNFGAKGDGVVDDTKAFQGAWAEACKVEASTVLVPWGYEFLVGPISFSGPYCQPNIVFQLDGMIIAPKSPKAWGAGLLQWLEFTKLRGITIQGRGVIEGQGSVWWTYSQSGEEPISADLNGNMPSIKPTALRFYGSYNVTVTGITIQNSPQCHLKFDNCEAVMVFNMTISSPGDSLNTDGIHLQNSQSVSIHHVNVACGDDCVSIQTGCSDVKIHSIHCGPGHGISIGGLGRDNTKACVSNITVQDVDIHNTMTGVRIKTWQGGSGSVQGIKFSNIRMYEVQTPIVIDQFYCDRSTCKNQTSAVALTSISYESIIGTYTVEPVRFACSDFTPCSDISLTEVELKPVQEQYHMYEPFCWQAFGELYTPTVPPIFCLQNGKPLSNRVLADHDTC